jgi:hypothetical protein
LTFTHIKVNWFRVNILNNTPCIYLSKYHRNILTKQSCITAFPGIYAALYMKKKESGGRGLYEEQSAHTQWRKIKPNGQPYFSKYLLTSVVYLAAILWFIVCCPPSATNNLLASPFA